MLKKISGLLRWMLVTVGIVVLTSFTVDATLNNSISQSALGILVQDVTDSSCPMGTVRIQHSEGVFCIDAYEVAPGEVCEYEVPRNVTETRVNIAEPACAPESKENALPWTYVTYHQAQELCAKRNMRLPTHDEWYKAAVGTPDGAGKVCNLDRGTLSETGVYSKCQSQVVHMT